MRLIVFIILQFVASAFAAEAPQVSVKTSTLKQQQVYQVYNAIGKVNIEKRKDFFATVSGKVSFVSKKQGQRVNSGELVFAVEKDLADSILSQAQDSYNEALLSLKRSQSLYEKKVISSDALEKVKLEVSNAKMGLKRAAKEYESMVFIAPFDGVLGVIDRREGEYISANLGAPELLCSIVDDTAVQTLSIYLPAYLMDKIAENTEVKVKYSSQNYAGKVVAKSNYISKSNGGFLTMVQLDKGANIPDGSVAAAELVFNKHQALTLPEQAVFKNNSGDRIYIVEDGKAKELKVDLGIRQEGVVEITSNNLSPDTKVVIAGIQKLFDGAKVQIINDSK